MIDKNIDKFIEYIQNMNGNSCDIVTRKIKIKNKTIGYIYLESVSSDDKISNFFMKDISTYVKGNKIVFFNNLFTNLENSIPNSHLSIETNYEEIFYKLASGYTCIFVDGVDKCITIETKSSLDRGVQEASSEAVVRGPKDSFTENHQKNIGLIRKRIKDKNLYFEDFIIGKRTKTKVTVSYINDIANLHTVKKIKKKLAKIDVDGILDSCYIREFLTNNQTSAFPRFVSTERPDLASTSLLGGKIVILVENSPFVLIIPGLFVDFIHSPEDNYQKWINVDFTRILRLMCLLVTILTPGIYVALTTFNQEIVPDELLISLAVQREGVPFPTTIEIFIMIVTFEMLRESDIRIPNASGAAIGIVGALVLGEAAVTAGIVSPIVIIIVGLTSISGLVFTDIDFINGIRWWRFIFLFASTIIGIFGFTICAIMFVAKLASLEFDGVPYLAPYAPFLPKTDDGILRKPFTKNNKRANYLTKNTIKMVNHNEKEI